MCRFWDGGDEIRRSRRLLRASRRLVALGLPLYRGRLATLFLTRRVAAAGCRDERLDRDVDRVLATVSAPGR
jgi:hypothetical protein